ncbi:hypothetical protein [Actinoplanes sp. NPDC051494]|uniref:hypothetical protein n=1 Tax=Actinoplanes sp. NPDC051494 TaxID=3363907 RepID=UPI00378C0B43
MRWIRVLHLGTGNDALWAALTGEFRLTVAQHYLISIGRENDDEHAARLSAPASEENGFRYMVDRQCQAWRDEHLPLVHTGAVVAARPVGAYLEMVTVAGQSKAEFRFLVRHSAAGHSGSETSVAAVGHKLPVPGWPPTQWPIPHLLLPS